MLTTAELLESILLHLAADSLARSQQVCRRWKNIVRGSPLLLKNLFIDTDGVAKELESTNMSALPKERLRTINHGIFGFGVPMRNPGSYKPHPIIMQTSFNDHLKKDGYGWHCEFETADVQRMLAWRDEHWTTMLVTQPPSTFIQVKCFGRLGALIHQTVIRQPSGIILGVLIRALMISKLYDEGGERVVIPNTIRSRSASTGIDGGGDNE